MTMVGLTGKRSSGTVVDARMSFAVWLRAGRGERGLSLEDVAKITKIQVRILERLEGGKLEGLPADVFVRGFVRNFARCVGLDEAEALRRYGACGRADGTIGQAMPQSLSMAAATPLVTPTATARALVETMSDLAPITARAVPGVPTMLTSPMAEGTTRTSTAAIVAATEAALASTALLADASVEMPAVVIVEPTPVTAEAPITVAPPITGDVSVAAVTTEAPKKRSRRTSAAGGAPAKPAKPRSRRKALAVGTDVTPIVAAPAEVTDVAVAEPAAIVVCSEVSSIEMSVACAVDARDAVDAVDAIEIAVSEAPLVETVIDAAPAVEDLWAPRMPPLATTTAVPWRRPSNASHAAALATPTLVIDDADPESAEQELEARQEPERAARRSFLPPILLDREDRSARQGGLTLAVIILLIAATLTLSYLMRRPSSSGEGVTSVETSLPIA